MARHYMSRHHPQERSLRLHRRRHQYNKVAAVLHSTIAECHPAVTTSPKKVTKCHIAKSHNLLRSKTDEHH
jgi:hypothetical protein